MHQTQKMDGQELIQLFIGIGLSEIKAKETAKNATVSAHLKTCIDAVGSKKGHAVIFVHPLENENRSDS